MILSIALLQIVDSQPFFVHRTQDLSNFNLFQRSTALEITNFAARQVVSQLARTPKKADSLSYKEYVCHFLRKDLGHQELFAVAISEGFSPRIAYTMLTEALTLLSKTAGPIDRLPEDQQLPVPEMAALLKRYNSMKPDKIAQIEADIDETKRTLIDVIDKLVIRGEDLENLAAASQDLTFKSRLFVKKTHELDKCCNIL